MSDFKIFCESALAIIESISQSDKGLLPLKLQLYKLYGSYNNTRRDKKHAVLVEMQEIVKQIQDKERQLAVERKQREIAENAPRQEEARKRSASRVQVGEFSIWMKDQNQELITKDRHVWCSDRTPITVDGKVCVGPRLGSYMGIDFGSIHFSLCGISRNSVTMNGVTYDGTNEPQLY
jgi:hypothetical protein